MKTRVQKLKFSSRVKPKSYNQATSQEISKSSVRLVQLPIARLPRKHSSVERSTTNNNLHLIQVTTLSYLWFVLAAILSAGCLWYLRHSGLIPP